jgi:hypothetical protein
MLHSCQKVFTIFINGTAGYQLKDFGRREGLLGVAGNLLILDRGGTELTCSNEHTVHT